MIQNSSVSGIPANPGIIIQQQAGQPLFINDPDAPSSQPKKVRGFMALGILHIVFGALSAILGIVAIIIYTSFSILGDGIWSGILFFLVTGILCTVSAVKGRNRCLIIAIMVMSIISSCAAFQLMMVSMFSAVRSGSYYNYYGLQVGIIAVDGMLTVIALAEMVISIVTASLSCYGVCICCGNPDSQFVMQYVPQQQQQQQQQQGIPSHQMVYTPQPVAYTPPLGTQYQQGIAPGQVVIATAEAQKADEAVDMDGRMFYHDKQGLVENA